MDRLYEAGVIVRFVHDFVDETEPGYIRLIAALTAAQQDNHRRMDKIGNTASKKRADGKWQGMPPVGCERTTRNGMLIPSTQMAAIKWLFDRALAGDTNAELKQGLRREHRLRWEPWKIRLVLQNRTYCGQFADGTTGQFWEEPPIPTIIFEQVQQRFRRRGRRPKVYGEVARVWPFVGVVTTACGVGLTCSHSTGHGGRYWYAHCTHRRKETKTALCPRTKPALKPEAVMAAIRAKLGELSLDAEARMVMEQNLTGRVIAQREARQRDRRTVQVRHDEVTHLIAQMAAKVARETDPDIETSLREAMKEQRREQVRLASQITELETAIARDGAASVDDLKRWALLLDDLPALWDRLAPAQQRELLLNLVGEGGFELTSDGKIRTAATSSLIWSYEPFPAETEEEWAHQDSNLGRAGYEPAALTAELWALMGFAIVPCRGLRRQSPAAGSVASL